VWTAFCLFDAGLGEWWGGEEGVLLSEVVWEEGIDLLLVSSSGWVVGSRPVYL
jgi:hypothetical protein